MLGIQRCELSQVGFGSASAEGSRAAVMHADVDASGHIPANYPVTSTATNFEPCLLHECASFRVGSIELEGRRSPRALLEGLSRNLDRRSRCWRARGAGCLCATFSRKLGFQKVRDLVLSLTNPLHGRPFCSMRNRPAMKPAGPVDFAVKKRRCDGGGEATGEEESRVVSPSSSGYGRQKSD